MDKFNLSSSSLCNSTKSGYSIQEMLALQPVYVGLKTLLDKNIDPKGFRSNRRMDREVFEFVFYEMLVVIDPNCKRKFQFIYPPKSIEHRTKFVQTVTEIINDKRLFPNQVIPVKLTTLGGGPFRQILQTVLSHALEARIGRICRKLNTETDSLSTRVSVLINERAFVQKQVDEMVNDYQSNTKEQEKKKARFHMVVDLWFHMHRSFGYHDTEHADTSSHRELTQSIDVKFVDCMQLFEEHNRDVKNLNEQLDKVGRDKNRRKSKAFMKLRNVILKVTPRKSVCRYKKYEQTIDSYITVLNAKLKIVEQTVLDTPKFQERLDWFKSNVPKITLDFSCKQLPCADTIKDILTRNPNNHDEVDDVEVLAQLKEYLV